MATNIMATEPTKKPKRYYIRWYTNSRLVRCFANQFPVPLMILCIWCLKIQSRPTVPCNIVHKNCEQTFGHVFLRQTTPEW